MGIDGSGDLTKIVRPLWHLHGMSLPEQGLQALDEAWEFHPYGGAGPDANLAYLAQGVTELEHALDQLAEAPKR
jgi:hypothetical protein